MKLLILILIGLSTVPAEAGRRFFFFGSDGEKKKCEEVVTPKPRISLKSESDSKEDEKARAERLAQEQQEREVRFEREKREREERLAREAKEREERLAREAKEKEYLSKELKSMVTRDRAESTSQIHDEIGHRRLTAALKGMGTPHSIALMVGNSFVEPNSEDIEYYTDVVKLLVKNGRVIVYDADTYLAKHIYDVAKDKSIGISAGKPRVSGNATVVTILNPYIRMLSFALADEVTTDGSSVAGLGMLFNDMVKSHFSARLSGESKKSYKMYDLSPTGENFGVRFSSIPWLTVGERNSVRVNIPTATEVVSSLNLNELRSLVSSQQNMTIGAELLDKHQKATGAVVFGSGGYPGEYTDVTYNIVRYLASQGIPIVTGGAGGVMQISNQAAFDAGSESIGIGLGGRLSTEAETKSDIHTLSMDVGGYEERIPLLLRGRKIVVIAPGGMGTMKELATTLVEQAAIGDEGTCVIFIGKKYYSETHKMLTRLLPEPLKSSLHLVETEEEIETIIKFYTDHIWGASERELVYRSEETKPRNSNTKFTLPTISLFSSKSFSTKGSSSSGSSWTPSSSDNINDEKGWWE